MALIAATYLYDQGGIVYLTEKLAEWTPDGKWYAARWTWNFYSFLEFHISPKSRTNLQTALNELSNTPGLEQITDLGNYPLYARVDKKRLTVSLEQDKDYTHLIRAKNVPIGSGLAKNADMFFIWWKGQGSVDRSTSTLIRK